MWTKKLDLNWIWTQPKLIWPHRQRSDQIRPVVVVVGNMSERDSSEFETSEFCLKTKTRVSVQKHKKWILTGLSFLNKSRGWISTNLVPVPTQIQISGSGQWVDCRMWQLQKISHPKLELWIATSNFNFKKSTFQHWGHCQWTKLGAKLSRNFLSNIFSILLQFQKEISYSENNL